ncbi:protein EMSY-LIKE 3-like [Hevea brasiliensis]|nr:protein EMSY-LIKE 3-like [Hevea brasiliensis]
MKVVNHNFQGPLSNKRGPAQSHVKKGIHMPDSGKFKNRSEFIEIHATDTIIHEVERMTYGRENPDPVQVEKAKLILRDHERAILGALDKLANVSDVDDSPNQLHYSYEEPHGNKHNVGEW